MRRIFFTSFGLLLALQSQALAADPELRVHRSFTVDQMRLLDFNQDGKIDLLEQQMKETVWQMVIEPEVRQKVEQLRTTRAQRQATALQKLKTQFDADNNGVLNSSEMSAMESHLAEKKAEFLAKYDKNQDGKVTAKEYQEVKIGLED